MDLVDALIARLGLGPSDPSPAPKDLPVQPALTAQDIQQIVKDVIAAASSPAALPPTSAPSPAVFVSASPAPVSVLPEILPVSVPAQSVEAQPAVTLDQMKAMLAEAIAALNPVASPAMANAAAAAAEPTLAAALVSPPPGQTRVFPVASGGSGGNVTFDANTFADLYHSGKIPEAQAMYKSDPRGVLQVLSNSMSYQAPTSGS